MDAFHRKLMKFWIQSFLLGVPKIIVGFRTREGILSEVKEIETHKIPETVNSGPNPQWNADMCVNFAASFLDCKFPDHDMMHELLMRSFDRAEKHNHGRWRLENTAYSSVACDRAISR